MSEQDKHHKHHEHMMQQDRKITVRELSLEEKAEKVRLHQAEELLREAGATEDADGNWTLPDDDENAEGSPS